MARAPGPVYLSKRLKDDGRAMGLNPRDVTNDLIREYCRPVQRIAMDDVNPASLPGYFCYAVGLLGADRARDLLISDGKLPPVGRDGKYRLSSGQKKEMARLGVQASALATPIPFTVDGRIAGKPAVSMLLCALAAKEPVPVVLLFGIDVRFDGLHFDGHKRRSAADDISVVNPESGSNAATIAQAVQLIQMFSRGVMGRSVKLSRQDILGFCERHPEIHLLAELATLLFRQNHAAKPDLRLSRAMYLALLFIFGRVEPRLIEGILSRLSEWPDREWQNVGLLTSALHRDAELLKGQKNAYKTFYLFAVTFNAMRAGETLSSVSLANVTKWRRDTGRMDASVVSAYQALFPAIDGWTEECDIVWPENGRMLQATDTEGLRLYVAEAWSPDASRRCLETCNPNNRQIMRGRVERYGTDMELGYFALSSIISFRKDGTMSDGQHRMLASALSGFAFPVFIMDGISDDAFSVTDEAASGKFGEHLRAKYPQMSRDGARVSGHAIPFLADILLGGESSVARRDMSAPQKDEFFDAWMRGRFLNRDGILRYATSRAWKDLTHKNGLGLTAGMLLAAVFWAVTSGLPDAESRTEDFLLALKGQNVRPDGSVILKKRSRNPDVPTEANNAAKTLREAIELQRKHVDDGLGNAQRRGMDVITFQRPLLLAALLAWLHDEAPGADWASEVLKSGLPAILSDWAHPMSKRRYDPTKTFNFVTLVPEERV